MRKIIWGSLFVLFLILCLIGCAKIQTDGNTITYSRFGSQNLSDVSFEKKKDGTVKMKIGKQAANDVSKALDTAQAAIAKMP